LASVAPLNSLLSTEIFIIEEERLLALEVLEILGEL
jgi:hypothetical protein